MKRFLAFVVGAAAVSCVVHTNQSHEWVRKRASDDLKCPQGKITVHHYTNNSKKKGIVGCGHRVQYVERCERNRCWWEQRPDLPPPKDPK